MDGVRAGPPAGFPALREIADGARGGGASGDGLFGGIARRVLGDLLEKQNVIERHAEIDDPSEDEQEKERHDNSHFNEDLASGAKNAGLIRGDGSAWHGWLFFLAIIDLVECARDIL